MGKKNNTLLKDVKEEHWDRYTRFMGGKIHYDKDENVLD